MPSPVVFEIIMRLMLTSPTPVGEKTPRVPPVIVQVRDFDFGQVFHRVVAAGQHDRGRSRRVLDDRLRARDGAGRRRRQVDLRPAGS